MSKHNRQLERDIKYFHKALIQVDESIELPRSLTSDALLPLLDGIVLKPGSRVAASALSFLRSKMFSMQYAVSYAVALVLVTAVAYGMHSSGGLAGGGIVRTASLPESAITAAAQDAISETEEASPDIQEDAVAIPDVASYEAASSPKLQSQANSAMMPQMFSGEILGAGGGGEAVLLGQNESFSFMCRYNDRTDPDKAEFPVTIEIIGTDTNESAGFINIPDMDSIVQFYADSGFICVIGTYNGGGVHSRVYAFDGTDSGVTEVVTVPQPGYYMSSLFTDGILCVVTLDESGSRNVSENEHITTIIDVASGEFTQDVSN